MIYFCTKAAKGISVMLKARTLFDHGHETSSTLYFTFVYPHLSVAVVCGAKL